MDYDDTYAELNIQLGDSTDITFTPEEKQRSLQRAWNDSYVVSTVWDSSLVFDSSTFSYPVPTTMTTVKDIYIIRGSVQFPDPIDSDLYEVVDGNIQFRRDILSYLDDGDTIYVKGNYKINYTNDTLVTTNMQEYVLATAGYYTVTTLKYKKANLFLKNDITMSELLGLGQDLDRDRTKLRAMLLREFEGA